MCVKEQLTIDSCFGKRWNIHDASWSKCSCLIDMNVKNKLYYILVGKLLQGEQMKVRKIG